ncbi:fasciclin domain-containing protein [Phenylobacterium sp.]|jgi:uncharacterized surface protein with fasciclin (FAS1) repeats|uniref:fasciclin domain-containing protein n=1 Tax=Phenylobacterium sp. TaxID=1871053 RepID=UPI0025EB7B3F|nr:fasciclin domain-containing protein [Phenylobacterium sp.]MCA3720185.1 fasciclin domain-containing protein [Phenylobacterium sp.]
MSKFLPVFAVLLLSGGAASAQVPAAPAAPSAAPALLSAPVAPAGDVIETLRASGQFTTFLRAADLVGLTAFVKARPDITVLAPADAAFAALPAGEMDRLLAQANRAELQKVVLRHLINARVPFETFKGAVTSAPSMGGETIELNGDAAPTVGGAPVVQADVMAANGVVHVLGAVIRPPAS